jgi:hypothetical protein
VLIAAASAAAIQIERMREAACKRLFLGAMVVISYPKLGGKSSICQYTKFQCELPGSFFFRSRSTISRTHKLEIVTMKPAPATIP